MATGRLQKFWHARRSQKIELEKDIRRKAKLYRSGHEDLTMAEALCFAALTTPRGIRLDLAQVAARTNQIASVASQGLEGLLRRKLISATGHFPRTKYRSLI